jgi:hypothetical protein
MFKIDPLKLYNSYLNIVKDNALALSAHNGIFLREDEAGNIWISEDGIECFKVHGWHKAHNEVMKIVKRKELQDIESAR